MTQSTKVLRELAEEFACFLKKLDANNYLLVNSDNDDDIYEIRYEENSYHCATVVDAGYASRIITLHSANVEDEKPSELRQRPEDQPLPTEGHQDVHTAVMKLLEDRHALGIQRYGKPLQTNNGRNPYRDMVEELMDALNYAMQIILENKEPHDAV
jgi:hypothetical protein